MDNQNLQLIFWIAIASLGLFLSSCIFTYIYTSSKLERIHRRALREARQDEFHRTVEMIRDILKEKDKVYLEGVTIVQNEVDPIAIHDCAFLGGEYGLKVISPSGKSIVTIKK